MGIRLQTGFGSTARRDIIRFLDSYASLLVLLLAGGNKDPVSARYAVS
jgi:hypothetical protein